MASRYATTSHSSLHQRDPRSALFENYNNGGGSASRSTPSPRPSSSNPYNNNRSSPGGGGYGYGYSGSDSGTGMGNGYAGNGYAGNGYLGDGGKENGNWMANGGGSFRSATPNSRGQYSDAVLNELESQNNGQVEGIMGKVRMLKDMTVAIGDEIRDSSAMAEKMNDSFDGARVRLRGTMNRMLVMAEKTGVGWKVWLAFFAAVGMLFFYVWVF